MEKMFYSPCEFVGSTDAVAIKVVKAGSASAETEVNGITGATLTGNGIDAMVREGLTNYLDFINK